ncbi:MAG TPA: DNRLRE domain-containing protein [Acidimicrobiia bacterium]|nr:DNRLRE domain-containing protein [Acidimicrobiia bacterium]
MFVFVAGFASVPAQAADIEPVGGSVAAVETTEADPVLVGAGDVAGCGTSRDDATGRLLDSIPGTVFIAGDAVYEDGSAAEFANCFEPAWGRHKARIRPAIGDHELFTPGATPYFNYFGAAAGQAPKGYYSYDLGAWHVVVLSSQCDFVPGGCGASSPQVQWLRNDLASTNAECIAAVWHRPLFSSGLRTHGYDRDYAPFWETLQSFGADIVLNGHSHLYERFGRQNSAGNFDPNGIRQFTVGTGGRGQESFGTAMPNSEFRYRSDNGVLKLTLRRTSYDWQFIRATGAEVVDSGTTGCTSALDTIITSGPQGTTSATSASFGFASTRPGSTFECELDGAGFVPCTSPQTFAEVALGTHTFSVRASFGGETDASPATRTWTVIPAPPPPPEPITVEPEADARVVQGSPNSNFGTQPSLEVDNSPVVQSFLRFNVSGITGTVTGARLRLYATDPTGNGPAVYLADPNAAWTETGLTWNNRPARIGGILANAAKVSSGRYLEYDVTAAIAANGTYSFNLVAEATDGVDFNSREAAANRPQLVIETGTGTTFGTDADARVVQGSPSTNFGAQAVLGADNSPVVESFIRFDVSGLTGTVTRARLRLYVTDPTGNGPALYRVDPNAVWSEPGITWNNKPGRTGAAVANLTSISGGRYVEYDVTGVITANGLYTFNLVAESTDGADFNSKEASANRPQLVIDTV